MTITCDICKLTVKKAGHFNFINELDVILFDGEICPDCQGIIVKGFVK